MNNFRIASFNLENFAPPDVFFTGRDTDAPYDARLYAEKKRWIAGILDEGRPDLIGFQEVFSFKALQDAVNTSRYLEGQATVVAPGIENGENLTQGPGGRLQCSGPNLALATRFPVLSQEAIADFPAIVKLDIPIERDRKIVETTTLNITRFERPVLKVRVMLPGGIPATVLVAHLKSKRGKFLPDEDDRDPVVRALGQTRSLIVRAAEAVALRALIVAVLDDADGERGEPLILLGDLNDDVPAVTTQAIAGEQWDVQLYSAHDIQEAQSFRDISYTHIYNGRYEVLDHIFVSQELVRQFPKRIGHVVGTRIFNDHLRDSRSSLFLERPSVIIDGKKMMLPGIRSDHGIPVTEIQLIPQPVPSQSSPGESHV